MWQMYYYGEKMENLAIAEVTDYPQEWLEKALDITGRFEGRGYDNVTGNFDGMGISAGVLQWCLGQGSLQEKILKPYIQLYGSIDALNIFPKKIMDNLAKSSASAGIRTAVNEMHNVSGLFKKKYTVKPQWVSAWRNFLNLHTTVEVQKMACETVALRSIRLCKDWDMVTPRSFCWFFDLVTQNGSLEGVKKPKVDRDILKVAISAASISNQKMWKNLGLNDEQVILMIASYKRSLTARAAYQKDVLDRKGTIAAGVGFVHGDKFENIAY